jgi:hypothetical protein
MAILFYAIQQEEVGETLRLPWNAVDLPAE